MLTHKYKLLSRWSATVLLLTLVVLALGACTEQSGQRVGSSEEALTEGGKKGLTRDQWVSLLEQEGYRGVSDDLKATAACTVLGNCAVDLKVSDPSTVPAGAEVWGETPYVIFPYEQADGTSELTTACFGEWRIQTAGPQISICWTLTECCDVELQIPIGGCIPSPVLTNCGLPYPGEEGIPPSWCGMAL